MIKTQITILKVGINGEGIGYYNKKPVFIPRTAIGDQVEVELQLAETKTYFNATLVKVISPSPQRITPRCEHFATCGGCALMHIAQASANQVKVELVKQALNKYAHITPNVMFEPTLNPFAYRNQCKFVLGQNHKGINSGMFAVNSNAFVPINQCHVHEEDVERVRLSVVTLLQKHKVPIFTREQPQGFRNVVVRSIQGQTMVCLVSDRYLDLPQLYDEIALIPTVVSVYANFNADKKSHLVFGAQTMHLRKAKKLMFKLHGLDLALSPTSFFQLNTHVASNLYAYVASCVPKDFSVVEAYCGIGVMGCLIAPHVKKVLGFDSDYSSIVDANENAKRNKLVNATFKKKDASEGIKEVLATTTKFTLVVDPPRTGLAQDFIKMVCASKIKHVIYVSCNPSTLGKDLAILKEHYTIEAVKAFDMFPQTPLVETVVSLRRK